jgi:transcriptional regulator with XRE-family HTH domain
MTFSQLHERLRLLVLRRIDNGSLSAALLARQIGCSPAHISNFLSRRRRLGLDALDKLLRAQLLTVADLYPEALSSHSGAARGGVAINFDSVPLVDPVVAASNARVHSEVILDVVKVRSGLLGSLRDKCAADRRKWDRFVAVQVSEEEALLMEPDLRPASTALIDRHYNSTLAYVPGKRNIYAVRLGHRLRFRYAATIERQLVFSANDRNHIPELLALSEGQTPSDILVGRVFLVIRET